MPISSGFTRLTNLPGYQQQKNQQPAGQMPTSAVQSFQNQKLPGLSTGTFQRGADKGAGMTPSQQLLGMRRPETGVALSAKRTTDTVRSTNKRLMSLAQAQGEKRRQLEAQRAAAAGGSSAYQGSGQGYGAPRGGGAVSGPAVVRIQSILKGYPGLRITETLGDRGYDQAHGVARGPNSYHYDASNPAVDIAGSTAELNRLYRQLIAMGGWRQILWQVPGHYDHIHVA